MAIFAKPSCSLTILAGRSGVVLTDGLNEGVAGS